MIVTRRLELRYERDQGYATNTGQEVLHLRRSFGNSSTVDTPYHIYQGISTARQEILLFGPRSDLLWIQRWTLVLAIWTSSKVIQ